MLVLRRKRNEKVVIGDREVEIVIIQIGPDWVRLGFTADKGVPIHREEVFLSKQAEHDRGSGEAGADS